MSSTIGRYEVIAELGRGGMAVVYHARDPRFKRNVAIKVLPREFLHDPHFLARFKREAEIIAGLENPAIVPVYDFGDEQGQPFIVMRYMSGGSLADKLDHRPVTFSEAARIMGQLAPALDYAHKEGVIHRDLKPGNILFDQHDNTYLSDFGIAKLVEATAALTGQGIIGTPAYMSPEQFQGEGDIDGRSDIYSLGVILFQMLSGRLPFEADTPPRLMMKHVMEPVPSIRDLRTDAPTGLDGVIQMAMAKDRNSRFQTAVALLRALEYSAEQEVAPSGNWPQSELPTVLEDMPGTPTIKEPQGESTLLEAEQTVLDAPPHPAARASRPAGDAPLARPEFETEAAPARRSARGCSFSTVLGVLFVVAALVGGGVVLSGMLGGGGSSTPREQPTESAAVSLSDTGKIAFTVQQGSITDIYVIGADGSGVTRLTVGPAWNVDPAWSPDGTRIVFASHRDHADIYLMNADGSNVTQLTDDPSTERSPVWSPDGTRIAFLSRRDVNDTFDIYVMNADGSNITRLTNTPDQELDLTWSSDSRRLAFARFSADSPAGIFVMDADGANITRITTSPDRDTQPAWSPDGTRIAFSRLEGSTTQIYLMNPDGSNITLLTGEPASNSAPDWSRDGAWIAFTSRPAGTSMSQLYVMQADGSNVIRVGPELANDEYPAWQP